MNAKVCFEIIMSTGRQEVTVEANLSVDDITLLDRACRMTGQQKEAATALPIIGDVEYKRANQLINYLKEEAKIVAGVNENDCCIWKLLSVMNATTTSGQPANIDLSKHYCKEMPGDNLWYMILDDYHLLAALETGSLQPEKVSDISTLFYPVWPLDVPDDVWRQLCKQAFEGISSWRILFRSKGPVSRSVAGFAINGIKSTVKGDSSYGSFMHFYRDSIPVEDWFLIDKWDNGQWEYSNVLIRHYQHRLGTLQRQLERQVKASHEVSREKDADFASLRKQLTSSSEIYSKAIADLQHKANLAENFNIQLIRDIERLSADELFFKNIELSDSLKNEQFEREVAIEARDDALRGLCDRDRHIEYCHRLLRRHGITFNPVVGHQVDVRRAA